MSVMIMHRQDSQCTPGGLTGQVDASSFCLPELLPVMHISAMPWFGAAK